VRKVRSNGEIRWGGEMIFLSQALIGEPVGIAETEAGDWLVRFAEIDLGIIDRRTGRFRRFTAARRHVTGNTWTGGRCSGRRRSLDESGLPRWVHRDLPRSAPPDAWRSLRSARVLRVAYLDKPSHPSRRQRAADAPRTYRENCQPCIRSIVSGMFPVAHKSALTGTLAGRGSEGADDARSLFDTGNAARMAQLMPHEFGEHQMKGRTRWTAKFACTALIP
jgi:hypothetical protein